MVQLIYITLTHENIKINIERKKHKVKNSIMCNSICYISFIYSTKYSTKYSINNFIRVYVYDKNDKL